jgi:hypothetical protein
MIYSAFDSGPTRPKGSGCKGGSVSLGEPQATLAQPYLDLHWHENRAKALLRMFPFASAS